MVGDWIKNLCRGIEISDQNFEPYRKRRAEYLRHYQHAVGDDAANVLPLNIVAWTVNVLLPHLMYRHVIEAMIEARDPWKQPEADWLSQRWGNLSRQIHLAPTLQDLIVDAMFGPSIAKTGLSAVQRWDSDGGILHDPGQAYCDAIDFDDYILDPRAKRREQASFEGNRFWVSRKAALDSGMYDNGKIEDLAVITRNKYRGGVDEQTKKGAGLQELHDLDETICLAEVWLPREGMIVTVPGDASVNPVVLSESNYVGPERGPYEMLIFHKLPSNVLGVPPVAHIWGLHRQMNSVSRKLTDDALTAKTVTLYDQTIDQEEAVAVQNSANGEMVGVQDSSKYAQLAFGLPQRELYEWLAHSMQQVNRMAGNPELTGGSMNQSPTLGQDQMLFQSANQRIADMRLKVGSFVNEIGRRLLYYIRSNEHEPREFSIDLPGGQRVMSRIEGDLSDIDEFEFRVDLYSQLPDLPDQRAQRSLKLAEMAMQLGQGLDGREMIKDVGRLLDVPGAQRWLKDEMPTPNPGEMPEAPTGVETEMEMV